MQRPAWSELSASSWAMLKRSLDQPQLVAMVVVKWSQKLANAFVGFLGLPKKAGNAQQDPGNNNVAITIRTCRICSICLGYADF